MPRLNPTRQCLSLPRTLIPPPRSLVTLRSWAHLSPVRLPRMRPIQRQVLSSTVPSVELLCLADSALNAVPRAEVSLNHFYNTVRLLS